MTANELYFISLWIWLLSSIPTFILLLRVTAPFGRHATTKWGPVIPNRWAWFVMEFPALLVLPICYFVFATDYNSVTLGLVAAWVLHYFNRVCIFPFRLRTKGRSMPLVIVISALSFNFINGFFCGYFFAEFADYSPDVVLSPLFILGFGCFVGGLWLNWQSDSILISLRRPAENHYVIPQRGLFRWISCPNHLGEIIEWLGFALMAMSLPTSAFALWVVANLLPRALAHHKWYLQQFPDYPAKRKAIIPLLL